MTLEELIREKLERLDSVPDAFITQVERAQKAALQSALKSLNSLQIEDGRLVFSKENLAAIENILSALKKSLFEGEYLGALREFAGEMQKQSELTNKYFQLSFEGLYQPDPLFKDVVKNSQLNTLKLLDESAIDSIFIQPLRQIFITSMSTGASMPDAVKALTNYIDGDSEMEGKLLRYVKQVSYDAFAISDRNYTETIARALDVQWYMYQGGTMRDTREFCKERVNKFYSKKEIGNWYKLDWQGKRPDTNSTNIYAYCGGYNCKHALLPVSKKLVPEADLIRAGNI